MYCDIDGCHTPNIWHRFLGFHCLSSWFSVSIVVLHGLHSSLCALWLYNWESLPDWNLIVIGVLAATGVQHLIVACACRFLIYKHPDLDENNHLSMAKIILPEIWY